MGDDILPIVFDSAHAPGDISHEDGRHPARADKGREFKIDGIDDESGPDEEAASDCGDEDAAGDGDKIGVIVPSFDDLLGAEQRQDRDKVYDNGNIAHLGRGKWQDQDDSER